MSDQFIGVKPVEERHRIDAGRLEDYLKQHLGNFRGPLTIKHPYLPDDVQWVVAPIPTKAEVDKVLGYWRKYVGK